MPLSHAAVLGAIQGLSEFLPISSSGHLILARALLRWPDPGLYFDVALHGGTLIAVLIYFRAVWRDLARAALGGGTAQDRRLLLYLVVATIPGAVAGKLLEKYAEEAFRAPALIAANLIVFGLLMGLAEHLGRKQRTLGETTLKDAGLIGLAQTLAIVPGVSRSGSTITAGLALGLDRGAAARFSFLMSTPIIGGAALLGFLHLRHEGVAAGMRAPFLVGVTASAVVGYAAVAGFIRFLTTHSLRPFVVYRVVAGAAVLALVFAGVLR
jgi:undecaprenyl-diphosphatase